jgi:hypothetical protein
MVQAPPLSKLKMEPTSRLGVTKPPNRADALPVIIEPLSAPIKILVAPSLPWKPTTRNSMGAVGNAALQGTTNSTCNRGMNETSKYICYNLESSVPLHSHLHVRVRCSLLRFNWRSRVETAWRVAYQRSRGKRSNVLYYCMSAGTPSPEGDVQSGRNSGDGTTNVIKDSHPYNTGLPAMSSGGQSR